MADKLFCHKCGKYFPRNVIYNHSLIHARAEKRARTAEARKKRR